MSPMIFLAGGLAALLTVYLAYAMLFPENFG